MRNRVLLALLAILALFAAACGDDDAASSDDEAADVDPESNGEESEEEESDDEESDDGGSGGGGDFCAIAEDRTQAFAALSGADVDSPDDLSDALAAAANFFADARSSAPEELRDDVTATAEFFDLYAEIFEGADFNFANLDGDALQEFSELDFTEFTDAQFRIESWIAENCSG